MSSWKHHFTQVVSVNFLKCKRKKKLCWIFSKAFSTSIDIITWFLSFSWLLWYITLIDLPTLKNPWIPEINLTWSWWWFFYCVVGFCLLVSCWGFLHLCSSVILAHFIFLWHFFLILVLGQWWPHRMSLEVYLPLQFSGRVWVG